MLRKELRGRKLKITRTLDAEERFHQKRMGYVKYCIHVKRSIPLDSISTNWTLKHISVKGQIVVKNMSKRKLEVFAEANDMVHMGSDHRCVMSTFTGKNNHL